MRDFPSSGRICKTQKSREKTSEQTTGVPRVLIVSHSLYRALEQIGATNHVLSGRFKKLIHSRPAKGEYISLKWKGQMGNTELFGKIFDCECGKKHHIQPATVVLSENAVEAMPLEIKRLDIGTSAVVLMDHRTQEVAGEAILDALNRSGFRAMRNVVPDDSRGNSPVCDDVTKSALVSEIPQADFFVSVGSGVITDLAKWISFDRNIPFVVFATAASMNGFTSANVAPTIKGLKTLVRAEPPRAVFSSPKVLCEAPYEMTASGLGDILAKSVSSADWRLNNLLFGDYYCARSVNLIADIEPLYLNHPQDILNRRSSAIEALFQGLLLTGAAMTMAETSSPSSGGEHLISHTLDMLTHIDGTPHDLHGRQVGVGTILAAELYDRILRCESPTFGIPSDGIDRDFWGVVADVVENDYRLKAPRLESAVSTLSTGNTWDALRKELASLLRPPSVIHSCLSGASAAYLPEHIGCSRERLLNVFLHAHEVRSRFTVLDLARLVGVLPSAAEEIIDQWM